MAFHIDTIPGRFVASLGHVAGMLDLVILPLWVGGLIANFGYSPVLGGGIVTLYLTGVLIANLVVSRRFGRVSERAVAALGYGLTAILFAVMARVGPLGEVPSPALLAGLHLIAGLGAGAGVAVIHGTIGRSKNPHGAMSAANLGVGIFGIAFFATVPMFVAQIGVAAVFIVAASVIGLAAIISLLAFPSAPKPAEIPAEVSPDNSARQPGLRLVIAGLVLLMLGNAVTLSFVERIADFRAFDVGDVAMMLVAGGLMALIAPILAHLSQHRIPIIVVAIAGPIVHGLLSITVSSASSFLPFAICYVLMVPTVIFTHTFVFALLARLDLSGKINAATASMVMFGAATGPFLGGAVAETWGYPAVGILAMAAAFGGAMCFVILRKSAGKTL